MAIEGMVEFCICSYLNAKTAEFSSFGEIMGILLSGFCLLLSSMFYPLTTVWFIITKSAK